MAKTEPGAADLIRMADESHDESATLELYERAVAAEPENGEAIFGVAISLRALGRQQDALARVRSVLKEGRLDAAGQVWAAAALAALGEAAEATRLLERVQVDDSTWWSGSIDAALHLAQAWSVIEHPDRVVEVLSCALATGAPADDGTLREARLLLGRSLFQLDRWSDGLKESDAVLAHDPGDAEALLESAKALIHLNRVPEGIDRIRRAVRTEVIDHAGLMVAIDLLSGVEATDDATKPASILAQIESAADSQDRDVALSLAGAWLAQGDASRACRLLDVALADPTFVASGDGATALQLRVVALVRSGDAVRAVADLGTLHSRGSDPTEPNLRLSAGIAYNGVGRFDDALSTLTGLPDTVSENLRPLALYHLGLTTEATGDPTAAEPLFQEAYSLATDRTLKGSAALHLALVLPRTRLEDREHLLEEADKLLPGDSTELRTLLDWARATQAVLGERWADVLALTEDLAARVGAPLRPTVIAMRARALIRCQRLDDAAAILDECLQTDEAAPTARYDLLVLRGGVRRQLRRRDEARSDFADALKLADDPDQQLQLQLWIAQIDLALGRSAAALATLDSLASGSSQAESIPQYWDLRTAALFSVGDGPGTVEAARRLAEVDPTKQRQARFAEVIAGAMLDGSSNLGTALAEFAEEPPKGSSASDWLITAISRQGRPDALDALDRAVKLDPAVYDSQPARQVRMFAAMRKHDLDAFDAAASASDPASPEEQVLVHYLRGETLLRPGDSDTQGRAVDEFTEVARIAAAHPAPLTSMQAAISLARKAQVLIGLDELPHAQTALDDAESQFGSIPAGSQPLVRTLLSLTRAVLCAREDDLQSALQQADQAETGADALPAELQYVVHYLKGALLRLANDPEGALRALQTAAAGSVDADVLFSLAEVQAALGDHDDALGTLDRIDNSKLEPVEQAKWRRLRSIVLRRLGRFEGALIEGREALAIDPDAASCEVLAAAYEALGRLDQAATTYQRAWTQSRSDERTAARSIVGLSRVLVLAGRNREALDALDSPTDRARIRQLSLTYGAIPFNRAVALLRCKQEERARHELQAARTAKRPAAEAADISSRLSLRQRNENSYLGFWFMDGAAGWPRRVTGVVLLILIAGTTFLIVADPATVSWLSWTGSEITGRLVPLLIVTGLFLLPIATRLKLGSVEIEQPAPTAPDLPDLQPMSDDELLTQIDSMLSVATRRISTGATLQTTLQTKPQTTAGMGIGPVEEISAGQGNSVSLTN
jgi:tetratricopeptide (TPR) repeat protein